MGRLEPGHPFRCECKECGTIRESNEILSTVFEPVEWATMLAHEAERAEVPTAQERTLAWGAEEFARAVGDNPAIIQSWLNCKPEGN